MFLLFSSRDHASTDVTLIDVVSSWPMRIRNFNVKIMLDDGMLHTQIWWSVMRHRVRHALCHTFVTGL